MLSNTQFLSTALVLVIHTNTKVETLKRPIGIQSVPHLVAVEEEIGAHF